MALGWLRSLLLWFVGPPGPDQGAAPGVKEWRERRERLIAGLRPTARQLASYDPFPSDLAPRIKLYFEGRGPDGRFVREQVDWQGYEFRNIPFRSSEEWRDWHIAQEVEAFRRLLARLKRAENTKRRRKP